MAALEQYEAEAGDKPTVEGALHAFLDTDLDLYFEGGEGWMNYAAFGARVSNTPEGAALMDVHFDPVVLKLVSILKRALPDYSDEDIFWGYHFVTGALMNTLARTGRIDRLSGGLCHSDDFPAVKKRMAKFMAAGFLALKNAARKIRGSSNGGFFRTDRLPRLLWWRASVPPGPRRRHPSFIRETVSARSLRTSPISGWASSPRSIRPVASSS